MQNDAIGEWAVIKSLLPEGWEDAARRLGAFRRARYITDPGVLLRLLLFHAVNDGGLRETAAQLRASGIAEMSQVALFKRLRTCGDWLAWIGAELASEMREEIRVPLWLRPRLIDATTVQGPAAKETEWRIHFSLDLATLNCDWFELTDGAGGERLERTPISAGDLLIGDRGYLRNVGLQRVVDTHAHALVRLKWKHMRIIGEDGERFHALDHARELAVGAVGDWDVRIESEGHVMAGRVIATRLPAPVAEKAVRKTAKALKKKAAGRKVDPRSLQAAELVMLFTTLTRDQLSGVDVLELYRYRWQVELAFKRLKQLLKLGRLPHKNAEAARGWILAKLVVALLLEKLFRQATSFSPWGFDLPSLSQRSS